MYQHATTCRCMTRAEEVCHRSYCVRTSYVLGAKFLLVCPSKQNRVSSVKKPGNALPFIMFDPRCLRSSEFVNRHDTMQSCSL